MVSSPSNCRQGDMSCCYFHFIVVLIHKETPFLLILTFFSKLNSRLILHSLRDCYMGVSWHFAIKNTFLTSLWLQTFDTIINYDQVLGMVWMKNRAHNLDKSVQNKNTSHTIRIGCVFFSANCVYLGRGLSFDKRLIWSTNQPNKNFSSSLGFCATDFVEFYYMCCTQRTHDAKKQRDYDVKMTSQRRFDAIMVVIMSMLIHQTARNGHKFSQVLLNHGYCMQCPWSNVQKIDT